MNMIHNSCFLVRKSVRRMLAMFETRRTSWLRVTHSSTVLKKVSSSQVELGLTHILPISKYVHLSSFKCNFKFSLNVLLHVSVFMSGNNFVHRGFYSFCKHCILVIVLIVSVSHRSHYGNLPS